MLSLKHGTIPATMKKIKSEQTNNNNKAGQNYNKEFVQKSMKNNIYHYMDSN